MANNIELVMDKGYPRFFYSANNWVSWECFRASPDEKPGWVILGWHDGEQGLECIHAHEFGQDAVAALTAFGNIVAGGRP